MEYLISLGFIAGQIGKVPFFDFGGITTLDLLLFFICFLAIILRKFKFNPSNLPFKAGLVFVMVCLISLIFSPLNLNPLEKTVSFSYLVRFLVYLAISLLTARNFLQLKINTDKILTFSGVILAVLGLLQLVFIPDLQFLTQSGWDPHFYRTVSTFLDPNFAGAFFDLTLILLLFNTVKLSKRWQLAAFSLVFIALDTTFSRESYLMFGLSFLLISWFKKSFRYLTLTTVLCLILITSYLIYLPLVAAPKKVSRAQSATARINTWQQGITIWAKNPILGVGFNSYRFALREYQLGSKKQIESHGGASNDSSLLFVSSTTGVVGLMAYLFFLYTILQAAWANWQKENLWGLIVTIGLAGLIAQSFFANVLFYPPILAWLMMGIGQLSAKTSS